MLLLLSHDITTILLYIVFVELCLKYWAVIFTYMLSNKAETLLACHSFREHVTIWNDNNGEIRSLLHSESCFN
jgi:hypothetical protein